MAGGGAHEERGDVTWASCEEKDGGTSEGIYFPLGLLRSEQKRKIRFIRTSLTPQKAAPPPRTRERRGKR